jgi:pimeloyl-ACP methyl ester carboxylesterase
MTQTSLQQAYLPPMVISIHGILTAARWQKPLADTLGLHGLKHRAYDFGHFDLFRFAWNRSRQRKINEFYDFYGTLAREQGTGIDLANYRSRPSIIAHSFGSYIAGYAMQKFPDIRFDKVILCGSILPADFDWATLFHRDQVNFVLNDYGLRDFWASIVGRFISDAGPSGSEGFSSVSTVVSQERFEYHEHSDYFHRPHIENHWLPALRQEPSSLQVRHGRNISDNQQFAATLDAAAKIDDMCFEGIPHYTETQLPRGLSSTWIGINADIYTFLFDRERAKLAGYINVMPVTPQCFNEIKAGRKRDNQIASDDILPFIPRQAIKLYMMSIAIDPALRRVNQGLFQEPIERLLNGFISKLYYYATNHQIRVTEIVSDAWQKEKNNNAYQFRTDNVTRGQNCSACKKL